MDTTLTVAGYFISSTEAIQNVTISAKFDTVEAAEAFIALFPKSAGVKNVGSCSGYREDGTIGHLYYTVRLSITLRSNGVNGGKNETGVKRYKTIMRKAEAAGIAAEWTKDASNAYETRAAFEAALDA